MSQASVVLTIDKYSLRDLWLPAVRKEAAAVERVHEMCIEIDIPRNPSFEALNLAYCALLKELVATVEVVRERGGLLLIGGEF